MQRTYVRSLLVTLVIIALFTTIGFVLWIGGHQVITGEISIGTLSSFVFYSAITVNAINQISDVVGSLHTAAGATERIFELLAIKSQITESENPVKLGKICGDIKFKNVSFAYLSRPEKILSDISFAIEPGNTVALVGYSGAGKSTIIKLLLRFYDVLDGSITIDGYDIRSMKLHDLRDIFGIVSQDVFIFSSTVLENIRYSRQDASYEEVVAAAERANALEFIEALPKKFDTFVGEKGVQLSGGQRQRISIARAILKDPRILLLDEATSSLDAQNEKHIQDALSKFMQNRTTLVITHRLATIRNAHKIIVMQNGRIETIGNHNQLINNSKIYQQLANLQFTGMRFR